MILAARYLAVIASLSI